MQPLVALTLPLVIGASPRGQRLLLTVRSTVLAVVLGGLAFIGNPSGTFTALVKQPTPLGPNHPTPWAALAPVVTKIAARKISPVAVMHVHGHMVINVVPGNIQPTIIVSGGGGRIIDVVFALLVGVYIWRRPQDPVRLLWLAALVLASRCFFEPVMTPYYLAPPLILALVMVSRMERKRFVAALVLIGEITYFSYRHLGPWRWWLPVVAGLIGVVVLGYPKRPAAESCSEPIPARLVPDLHSLDLEMEGSERTLEPAG
jgi:hypothetical protein